MKDLRHHRSKLQKKVFREAKRYAMQQKQEDAPNLESKAPPLTGPEHHKKSVPIIRTHKKRFH